MILSREEELYRKDAERSGTLLTAAEREALLKPYLPSPTRSNSAERKRKTKPVRTFLKSQLYLLVFTLMHLCFSVYIHLRQAYHAVTRRISAILYYHHRTPELIQRDVKGLPRLPRHLSVVLDLSHQGKPWDNLGILLDNVAEISAWCACARIHMLSVYEKTGALKDHLPATHRTVASKLHAYFGEKRPSLQVRAPHMPSFLNGDVSEDSADAANLGKNSDYIAVRTCD